MAEIADACIPDSIRADLWDVVKKAFERYRKCRDSGHRIDSTFGWAQGELNMAVTMYSLATGELQSEAYETLEDLWINSN